jgi:hypothetical protein
LHFQEKRAGARDGKNFEPKHSEDLKESSQHLWIDRQLIQSNFSKMNNPSYSVEKSEVSQEIALLLFCHHQTTTYLS